MENYCWTVGVVLWDTGILKVWGILILEVTGVHSGTGCLGGGLGRNWAKKGVWLALRAENWISWRLGGKLGLAVPASDVDLGRYANCCRRQTMGTGGIAAPAPFPQSSWRQGRPRGAADLQETMQTRARISWWQLPWPSEQCLFCHCHCPDLKF